MIAILSAWAATFGRCSLIRTDRKSTRLNSSHLVISYAVFCLKKKKKHKISHPFLSSPSVNTEYLLTIIRYLAINTSHDSLSALLDIRLSNILRSLLTYAHALL